jgi:hypothetical protein
MPPRRRVAKPQVGVVPQTTNNTDWVKDIALLYVGPDSVTGYHTILYKFGNTAPANISLKASATEHRRRNKLRIRLKEKTSAEVRKKRKSSTMILPINPVVQIELAHNEQAPEDKAVSDKIFDAFVAVQSPKKASDGNSSQSELDRVDPLPGADPEILYDSSWLPPNEWSNYE